MNPNYLKLKLELHVQSCVHNLCFVKSLDEPFSNYLFELSPQAWTHWSGPHGRITPDKVMGILIS